MSMLLIVAIAMTLTFEIMAYENILGGKHFIFSGINAAAAYSATRNASGYIIKVEGMASYMIEWLSKRYNFTYSIFQSNETGLDRLENQTGLIYHLLEDHYQFLFCVVSTSSRVAVLDLSQPNLYIPVSYLILKPTSSTNIAAIVASFEIAVWVCLIVSIFFISFTLYSLGRFTEASYDIENLVRGRNQSWEYISTYVIGVLLNQGGYLPFKTMPYYVVGTVWCIATLVLVNAYNSTLISHVALPNQKPLVNSIYDLRDRPDVNLVTNKNLNTEAVLLSVETGLLKMLGDKLRSYQNSSCKTSKECVELVKSGSHVYTSGLNSFLYGAIKEDYDKTGKCPYLLQTEAYMNLPISLGLPKKSRYMKNLDLGVMHLREVGLIDEWAARSQPDPRQCLVKKTKHSVKSLTLNDLLGVFVVLKIGILVSFLVFIGEQILFRKFSLRPPRSTPVSKEAVEQ